MNIAGTKKKLQRMAKVAEETYKKINQLIQEIEELQEDFAVTSKQVDHMEVELAEQRALIEALAETQDLDVEQILDTVEYPDRLLEEDADGDEELAAMASSRPIATDASPTEDSQSDGSQTANE